MPLNEDEIAAKIRRRIVPLLMMCYFAAYLDRVNLSFAALTMNHDLGLSSTIFGAGAGIFFLGYVIFEVPSNVLLRRFGARRWFARIMISWGLLSLMFAFVQNATQFLTLRFLLGVAEAGFFPGVVLYLSGWFPPAYRARMLGAFAVAIPASTALGAPISGLLLNLDGAWGLRGWQWLFIVEALPSIVLGCVLLRTLTDSPRDARWLDAEERQWIEESQNNTQRSKPAPDRAGISQLIRSPLIWCLGFVYCGIVGANYGVTFFLPQIIKAFGVSVTMVGLLSSLPFIAGAAGLMWWSTHSDRTLERRRHLLIPGVISIIALTTAALTDYPPIRLGALTFAGFGAFANLPVFWTIVSQMLSDTQAAAGIAIVSSIGNLSGFFAPYAVGALLQHSGSFTSGMLVLAGFVSLTVIVAAMLLKPKPPAASVQHHTQVEIQNP